MKTNIEKLRRSLGPDPSARMPINVNDLRMQKAQAKEQAEMIVNQAMRDTRDLTPEEQAQFDKHADVVKRCSANRASNARTCRTVPGDSLA